jgi:hypothetical protein
MNYLMIQHISVKLLYTVNCKCKGKVVCAYYFLKVYEDLEIKLHALLALTLDGVTEPPSTY